MSLLDDIFDVEDAVKDLPEHEAFQRIENKLYEAQHEADVALAQLHVLKQCVKIQLNEQITTIKVD